MTSHDERSMFGVSEQQGQRGCDAGDPHELRVFLRTLALFSELDGEELLELAHAARVTAYAAGTTLFRQGDIGGSLFIVRVGEVRVVIEGHGREPEALAVFNAGQFFGELSLFGDGRRSETAIAVLDSLTIELPRAALRSKLTANITHAMLIELENRVAQPSVRMSVSRPREERAHGNQWHRARAALGGRLRQEPGVLSGAVARARYAGAV